MTATDESACGRAFMLCGGPHDGMLVGVSNPQLPVFVHDASGVHEYRPDASALPFMAYWQPPGL